MKAVDAFLLLLLVLLAIANRTDAFSVAIYPETDSAGEDVKNYLLATGAFDRM